MAIVQGSSVSPARSVDDIAAVKGLVWDFFDFLRGRYPDMLAEIDNYIETHNVASELADFASYFAPPHGDCFLARADGNPVGILMLKPHGERDGEFNRMYVRPEARGLGLGRALCRAAIDEARRLGMGTLYLDALYRHREALPLYESVGFTRYDHPDAWGGDDQRIVHMRLDLNITT